MTAPGLRELQERFAATLLAVHERPDTAAVDPVLAAVVRPVARLAVYADMYFWRLRDVLAEDFPKLTGALGAAFDDVVRAYLRAHPSRDPSVRYAGRSLADHLGDTPAGGLARLEWARVDAFDAADAAPLTRDDLAAVPPEAWPDLRFTLVPSLGVLESRWPVHRMWDDGAIHSRHDPVRIRVWRHDDLVWHAPMSAEEAAGLALAATGARFDDVCQPFEAPDAAAGALARWLDDGLLAAVHLPG